MVPTIVTVFGATGAQGGAVVKSLSCDPGYQVRAVTRNPRAQSSAHLHSIKDVEVIEADLNDVNSLKYALQGADACFLVTVTYFRSGEFNDEVKQVTMAFSRSKETTYENKEVPFLRKYLNKEQGEGKNVANVCKELGIRRIVYSTVDPDWKESTDIKVRELDQKIEIFNHMRSLSLPVVGVMPGFYYQNILDVFKPRKVDEGVYGFGLPLGGASWGLASVDDIGPLIHQVFTDWKEESVGEVIPMVTEVMSLQEMSDALNKHIPGAKFIDLKLSKEQVKQGLKEGDYRDEILRLFEVVIKSSVDVLKQKSSTHLPSIQRESFDKWVERNKDLFIKKVLN